MYRKTYVEIDEKILESNVKDIITKYPDYQYYIGVVKNNCYHHGIKVVNNLIKAGINYLAVSSLEEAMDIRKYNEEIPILVLEPVSLEYIDDCINHNITIMIENLDYVLELAKIKLIGKLKVHLKIDSGMNRLGFKVRKEVKETYEILTNLKKIEVEGIFTHLATSGISDIYYDKQINTFQELVKDIDLNNIKIIHVDRSITFVSHQKLPFVNGVRLGIVMFGFSNSRPKSHGLRGAYQEFKRNLKIKKYHLSPAILENNLKLQTAFKMYSEVLSIRKVKKGEVVGYSASYKVKEDGYILTIPCGYADGITKDFKYVAIKGKLLEIVADSMDMIMVFSDKKYKIGEKIEIFGDTISIRSVCKRLNINAYHLFNQIQNRVVRVYKNEDETIEIKY